MPDQVVKNGKFVSITYSIADDAGNILEQTDLPVSYIHGGRTELIGGMDQAINGRQAGEEVDMLLAPEQGFGPHDPSLTFTDDIANVPPQVRYVGAEVQMQNESGEVKSFFVTQIDDSKLTVDGNHPLAGKSLKVHVRIQEVRDPTGDELAQDSAAPDASCATPGTGLH